MRRSISDSPSGSRRGGDARGGRHQECNALRRDGRQSTPDVVGTGERRRPIPDEGVGSLGRRDGDGSRHRHDLAAGVEGRRRGNERTGRAGCFHHDGEARESCNQPVAMGKGVDARPLSGRELAQQQSLPRNTVVQGAIGGRIDDAEAVAQDAHRAAAHVERARLGNGIDTSRHAADHHRTAAYDRVHDQPAGMQPVVGMIAAADDGHRRLTQKLEPPRREEHSRWLGNFGEPLGKALIAGEKHNGTHGGDALEDALADGQPGAPYRGRTRIGEARGAQKCERRRNGADRGRACREDLRERRSEAGRECERYIGGSLLSLVRDRRDRHPARPRRNRP